MNKIPVGRTIAHSYGFAFGRYFTLFAIVWLPLLAWAALSYYLRMPMHDAMVASIHAGQGPMPQFARVNLLVQLVGLVLFAIMSVGITKEVLGLPRGPRFFYAGFGAAELRVIVGYFAIVLLFIVFVFAFVIAILILAGLSKVIVGNAASQVTRGIVALAIVFIACSVWLALIYALVRLTFLFLPATVAEKRIGIMRSWELTAGNFWRIFAIGAVVLLPVFVLGFAVGAMILGRDYITVVTEHMRDPQFIRDYVAQRMEVFYQNMPVILLGGLVVNPVVYGLIVSPAAFAYRALVPSAAAAEPVMAEPVMAEPVVVPPAAEPDSGLPPVIAESIDRPSDHGEPEQ